MLSEQTVCSEQSCENSGNNGHELDKDVDGRTGGILERIADGVADNGCLVGIGALAAVVAFLNVLLCVIPCAACVGHEHCHHNAGNEGACEQTCKSGGAKDETDRQRSNNCHDAGYEHFLKSSGGGDSNASLVVGLCLAFHDARDLTELTANFLDHAVCSLGNGVHSHSGEHEREHAADEQTDNNGGAGECNLSSVQAGCLSEGYKQCKCGQSSRADSEALAHCSGGVADSVELIGDLTHGVVKAAHFGDTAGVVGDRTVSVNCNGDAGGGKHTDCCECDAVKACEPVSKEDAYADKQDGYPSGHHADCGTGNDGGSRTGLGLLSDLLNELVVAGGVDLGDNADNETDNEAGDDCDSAAHAAEHRLAEDEGSNNDEKCGNIRAHLKSLVGVRAFLTADEEGCDNGSKNTAGCDNEGEDNTVGGVGNSDSTEGHCGDDSTDIALKQVSTHTGDIADIVADIVSDNSGVTRVILGDACLDLTDEVSTDIGCLGVDTAADTGKQSDRACAEGEAEQNVGVLKDEEQNGLLR